MKIKESISVIVPVYNEEDSLARAVHDLDLYLKDNFSQYEIIIVESGSTDDTAKIADSLKCKNIRAVHQKKREGYGSGLRLGFSLAKKDLVWYYSGDMPFEISYLRRAAEKIENFDAVIAYRTGERESLKRLIATNAYHILITTIFGLKVRDINFSFKLIRRELLQRMKLNSYGWFIDAEMQIEFKRNKARILQIPVKYDHREEGQSKVNLISDSLNMLREMFGYISRKYF